MGTKPVLPIALGRSSRWLASKRQSLLLDRLTKRIKLFAGHLNLRARAGAAINIHKGE